MRTKHPSPNPMLTRRQAIGALVASAPAALAGCTAQSPAAPTSAAPLTHTIRILATSDLHGKMLPYNYPADEADASGSLAQVATAVSQLRDENTLLIDVGDTIQDNMAEIFANDEAHPMVVGLNAVGYDIGVLGNHEFDFGMVCEQGEDGWKVASKSAASVSIAGYDPDPQIVELLEPYDERAKAHAREVVGRLEGGPLVAPAGIEGIPTALIQDTPLIDFINKVVMHYSGADVAVSELVDDDANIQPGDLTFAVNPNRRYYEREMPSGVTYEIDISRKEGQRIRNLCWANGKPVADDDSFVLAANNYRSNSTLLTPGKLFSEDDMPKLIASDLRSDIGSIREMVVHYIENECGGVVRLECDNNWKLVGYEWDPALHEQVVELVRAGNLEIKDDYGICTKAVTKADLPG